MFGLSKWQVFAKTSSSSCFLLLFPSWGVSHLGHGSLSLETSADAVIDTLGLSPAGVDTHEAVRLVAVEARGAYKSRKVPVSDDYSSIPFSFVLFVSRQCR